MEVRTTQPQIDECRRRLRSLENRLRRSGTMVAGVIIQRYTVCGKAGCRCQTGDRHGPYPALSRPNGEVLYLNRELNRQITAPVERYRAFQRHLTEWRRTVRELDRWFGELRHERMQELATVKSQRKKGR
jgi:hypothetical protein